MYTDFLLGVPAVLIFFVFIYLIWRGRDGLNFLIGLISLMVGKYILPPLADEEEYFYLVGSIAIPLVVFGGLLGILSIWGFFNACLRHLRGSRPPVDGDNT